MIKPIAVFTGLILLAIPTMAQNETVKTLVDRVSESSLKTNLRKIAGPATEGRMAGSKGDELAIQYVSDWFNTHHLDKPYNSPSPWSQAVPLTKVDYRNSSLTKGDDRYTIDKDWTWFLVDKAGTATNTEVVFIGYGLSVPAYDDLKDVDLEGKLILLESGAPTDPTGKPLIPKDQMPDFLTKMSTIRSKKPSGMLLCTADPIPEIVASIKDFRAFNPYRDMRSPNSPVMPGAIISKDVANAILGDSIDSIYTRINQSGKPHSFNTHSQVSLSIVETDDHKQSSNIIGVIHGTDTSLPGIVITAHHDHEGIVDGKTYNGADDNGTGTVALMEIVKVLGDAAATGTKPKRTIIFVSTAAEEQGLIGSTFYVSNPVLPMNKTYCSINIDMIGRVDSLYSGKRPDSNYVYTTYEDLPGNTINWEKMKNIDDACCQLKLDTLYNPKRKTPTNYGLMARADNFPFLKAGIPSLWFFGGFHVDYHQPGDTLDKINYSLLKQRTQLALATIWQLAND